MKNKLPVIIGICAVVFIFVIGIIIYQKSQVIVEPASTPPSTTQQSAVKKVDLTTQPEWIQKLTVTLTRGQSTNGLKNFTFRVTGLPQGMVKNVNYVVQYDTANKGSQGALSTKPLDVNGATELSKTIDLGTCSTHSCVTHDGVTSIDLELDFTTSAGDQPTWSKTLDLK